MLKFKASFEVLKDDGTYYEDFIIFDWGNKNTDHSFIKDYAIDRYAEQHNLSGDEVGNIGVTITQVLKSQITPQDVIHLLNKWIEKDSIAITMLMRHYVRCNDEIANTTDIKCIKIGGKSYFSTLGILNGLFGYGDDVYGPISMLCDVDDDDNIVNVVKFHLTDSQDDDEDE